MIQADNASESVGTTNYNARNDYSNLLNVTISIPIQDGANGSVGTTNYYARIGHSHPINVETNASNIPVVNGVGTNGSSTFYARQDHVHPQQLIYDGISSATKFIEACGLVSEVLLHGIFTAPTRVGTSYPIENAGQESQTDRGLMISANGNTLTFNG
ncbi:MAG: hypothetical protein EZS28_013739 [Streblomastix strix]|uniref:Uncharacterized protein n=1 Tax=Streblomastix strix TaxID=222440 RepID=A0A5J4W825_9EUKA|nr:MAG: hypothetical protein EZS28_013739 [Streblomastix strix]